MYTQCPKCRTIFNVTREILEVKAGLVRCGDCENVFNATWNLVDESTDQRDDTDPAPPAQDPHDTNAGEWRPLDSERIPGTPSSADRTEQEPSWHGPAFHPGEPYREDAADSEPSTEDISDEEIRRTLRLDEDLSGDLDLDADSDRHRPMPAASPPPGEETVMENGDDERLTRAFEYEAGAGNRRVEPRLGPAPPGELSVDARDALLPRRSPGGAGGQPKRPSPTRKPAIQLRTPPRRERPIPGPVRARSDINWVSLPGHDNPGSRWLWATGVVLLLVLVVLQIRFLLVEELYSIPSARPYISAFCAFAGCSPPARSDPASIRIAQTRVDLHPEVPGAMRVRVNLLNQAEFAQPYPAIQLSLSDKDGRIVGRRTYTPAQYLDTENRNTLLAPGVLAVASINLANPNEIAVGFEAVVVAGP
jgi:predicted Zn finger-like uncharacterized protein